MPWIVEIEALLGLPSLACAIEVDSVVDKAAGHAAKLAAALAVVEDEQRPLVWTDDDAIPVDGPELARLVGAGQPVLLIAPRSGSGLQAADITAIEAFLDGLSS